MSTAAVSTARRGTRRRPGFTFTELLVALSLLGIIGTAMVSLLIQQQRFYRGAADVASMRGAIRQATGILPMDLRGVSSVGNDIYAMTDRSIEVRSNTGSSIVCLKPTPTTLVLPPVSLAKGSTLTSWMTAPVAGDSILIYDDGIDVGNADDSWQAFQITGVATAAGWCPVASGFTTGADAAQPAYTLTLSPAKPMPTSIIPGAPVRFFRKVHYELYQTPGRTWYLGWYDCLPGRLPVCTELQPLSGPYRAYNAASPGTSGLTMTYFDSLGAPLDPAVAANRARVARVNITVRGQADQATFFPGRPKGAFYDSLSVVVGLRNRS